MTQRLAITLERHDIMTQRLAITLERYNIMTQRLAITLERHNIMTQRLAIKRATIHHDIMLQIQTLWNYYFTCDKKPARWFPFSRPRAWISIPKSRVKPPVWTS
jgi:hypothetical protein